MKDLSGRYMAPMTGGSNMGQSGATSQPDGQAKVQLTAPGSEPSIPLPRTTHPLPDWPDIESGSMPDPVPTGYPPRAGESAKDLSNTSPEPAWHQWHTASASGETPFHRLADWNEDP